MAQNDYETNLRAKKEIEILMALNEEQLKIVKALRQELDQKKSA